ncbi:hypothetical protein HDV00_007507 [Rhizophlyctis rosea]|nr:hypothetical protein HDV00_007507 [Rhizophlyctis rosea]
MLVEAAISSVHSVRNSVNDALKLVRDHPIAAAATVTTIGISYVLYTFIASPRTNAPKFKSHSSFLLGALPFFEEHQKTLSTHKAWQAISDEVGPVGWMKIANITMFVITDGVLAKHILNNVFDEYERSDAIRMTFGLIGKKQLMVLDDEEWRSHRKLMISGLSTSHLHHSTPQINDAVSDMLARWDIAEGKGEPVDAYKDLSALALEALGRALLNVKFGLFDGQVPPKYANARHDVEGVIEGFERRLVTLPPFWPFIKDNFKESVVHIRNLLNDLIESKRAVLAANGITKHTGDSPDLIATLLTHPNQLPQEQLIDELLLFFIAGHETSANSMTFTLALLAQHPSHLATLEAEIQSNLGTETHPSTPEQISHLKFLDAVSKESLRLHPVAGQLARRTRKNVTLGTFTIPAHSEIGVNIRGIHRNPQYWPEPDTFNPERWFTTEAQQNPHYMPFSWGPQMCLGMRWANLEMRIVVARVVQRFEISLVEGQELREVSSLTIGLKDGLFLRLKRRV